MQVRADAVELSRCLFLTGPTAAGKSAIAMNLASRLGGEIISVDSMQVYRGLDIGTAKPSLAERTRTPHHLIDILNIDEAFDAAQFIERAAVAAEDICRRRRVPIFCGGTGLYFKALMEGLGGSPPADPRLRAELESQSLAVLLEELKRGDPAAFDRIDRQNPRRIIRALEVIRLTGRPLTEQRAEWHSPPATAPLLFVGVSRPPADLKIRIDLRVERMFAAGLIEETQNLLACGLAKNRTAMQAIGYRQVAEFLQGVRSREETIELVKVKTRQFAKRQMTWFHRQAAVRWRELPPEADLEAEAENIAELYRQRCLR